MSVRSQEPHGRDGTPCRPLVDDPKQANAELQLQGWFIHLFLLMPDYLHALLSFPQHEQMTRVVRAWKKYQATHHGITWQRDFFDHRLRRDESFAEKADYIRLNPVRADLVFHRDEWPYVLAFDGRDGTPLPSVANPADGTECRPYRK